MLQGEIGVVVEVLYAQDSFRLMHADFRGGDCL